MNKTNALPHNLNENSFIDEVLEVMAEAYNNYSEPSSSSDELNENECELAELKW